MVIWILAGLLALSLAGNVWSSWLVHNAEVAVASSSATMDGAFAQLVTDAELIGDVRTELVRVREDARYEAREYMARAVKYENRISELVRQTQSFAERLASLRLASPDVVGGDDQHIEEVQEEKPYSVELFEWIERLENEETRVLAHDFVRIRRNVHMDDEQKMLVFRRGPLVFVCNFHPDASYTDYRIGVPDPADYQIVLDTDEKEHGGFSRIPKDQVYSRQKEPCYGRDQSIQLYIPARTVQVLAPIGGSA